ncbi:hypothetical protein PENTCL1PPCAC_18150, partial [Pristionchus entomophagus]
AIFLSLFSPLTPMMNLTPLLLILAQVVLLSQASPFENLHRGRLAANNQLTCTHIDPGYECFNGMCPESDRTCVVNGASDTCCLNKNIAQKDDPTPTDPPLPPPPPPQTEEPRDGPKNGEGTTAKEQQSGGDPPTTATSTTTGKFCPCDLDESGLAKDWAEQLWMDIVIILDTSAAMGQSGVIETTSIIESFIARMNLNDFSTPQYSRISLITASQWPKIHYFFNMSSDSDLSYIQSEPFLEFNFAEAFKAAQYLFNFYTPPEIHRSQVSRVIYLITNTRPPANVAAATQFKQDGGTIIVTDFVQEGAVPQPLLESLASPGYFFDDLTLDYTRNLQVFCGLNCFCSSSLKSAGSGREGGMKPNLGCFQIMTEPASFDRAIKTCENERMELATIHNEEEEDFLIRVKGLPHWFGLRHDNSNGFEWTDQESHSYSNWAVQEPELENNQNCGYALKGTSKKIEWFTGNCHLPFYYSCSSPPCSAERYCSEEELFGWKKMISQV